MGLKQHGNGFMTGTMGDMVYYQKGGQFYVRKRPVGLSKAVRTKECYANTRRNASEFKEAIKQSKRIRAILQLKIRGLTSNETMNRLHSIFIMAIKAGQGEWGKREINLTELQTRLKGYEFGRIGSFFDIAPYLMNLTTSNPETTAEIQINGTQVTSNMPIVHGAGLNIDGLGADKYNMWVAHIWHDGSDWCGQISESQTVTTQNNLPQWTAASNLPQSTSFVFRVIGIKLLLGNENWNNGKDDACIIDYSI